jgi:Dullard-like phosphatase family protein
MDECLIHAQFLSNPAAAQVYAHQLRQRRMNNVSAHGHVDSFRFALPDGELVHVNLRPGLRDFLQAVTDRFETHVFTAAVDVYADPLLDTLDPSGTMFAGRWYREHCVYDAKQIAYVKNLCTFPPVLNKNLDRVVLVDNNPLSFLANPSNGILVSSFYNDPTDKTLPAVWDLLQVLDNKKCDVRPHLDEQFGLKKALQVIQANDDAAKNNNNNNINIASKAAAA